MLNLKSRFDKGYNTYESVLNYAHKWSRVVGYVMEANLVDLNEIKKLFGSKMPIIGIKKEYNLNEQKFNVVFYPKTKRGMHLIMKLADFKQGEINDFKMIDDVKVVIESESLNPQIATLLEGFGILPTDIFYGIKSKEQVEVIEILNDAQCVDFRHVGYLDYQDEEKYAEFRSVLGIDYEQGISEYEFYSDKILGDADKTKEFIKGIIPFDVYSTNLVHLPTLKKVEGYTPSKAFYEILGNEVISQIDKKEIESVAYLFEASVKATVEQYGSTNVEVFKMMLEQVKLITQKNYTKYFLVVKRILEICDENDIERGRGRGSVVGFLLSKVLGITSVEPITYGLLPERFTSLERKDNVDIDMDISTADREKLLQLLVKEFGYNYVAQVMTKNKMGFKNSVKAYLKVHKVNPMRLEQMYQLNPHKYNSLEEFLMKEEAKALYEVSKDIRNLLDVCFETKDAIKSGSKNAAALIISDVPINSLVPVTEGDNGILIAQFVPENSGLIKMDLLGLKTLDVIKNTKKLIKQKRPDAKFELNLEDKKTIDLYKSGKLLGVFQMESSFVREAAVEMEISSFDDIVALNAMNRPGPKEFIPIYAERKKDASREWFVQGNQVVNQVCEDTYGIIVYQEQINKIAMIYSGYSAGEAEMFRRAVSKKDAQKLADERNTFVEKAKMLGRNESEAISVYDQIEKFADYGFNKGHSVAYGQTSFETAYYKANYPLEYMVSLMNSVVEDRKQLELYLNEVIDMGIPLFGVDINRSSVDFTIENGGIRLPFQVVSGLGGKSTIGFVQARNSSKIQIINFNEYIQFVKQYAVELPNIEDLIKVGAFDYTGNSRSWVLKEATGKDNEYTLSQEIKAEKTLQGVVLNKNAGNYQKYSEAAKNMPETYKFGEFVKVEVMRDKKDREMAKIQMAKSSVYNEHLVVFHNDWARLKDVIQEGETYLVKFVKKNVIKEVSKVE